MVGEVARNNTLRSDEGQEFPPYRRGVYSDIPFHPSWRSAWLITSSPRRSCEKSFAYQLQEIPESTGDERED